MRVKPWKRIEPTIVTKVGYRKMVIKTFLVPGKNKKVPITTYPDEGLRSAGTIALTKDKKVVIARQFRQGPEKIMNEIPGGGVQDNEDPEAAARRELAEETGYAPGAMEFLGASSRDAYMNGQWLYYLATDCVRLPQGAHPDENEQIEVVLMPIDEFLEMAKHDGMTDPAAVLMAYDKLKQLQ